MVREQIRASEELGLESWVLWNPRSAYDAAIFRADPASISVAPESEGSPDQGTN
jgi:hypothetical protein